METENDRPESSVAYGAPVTIAVPAGDAGPATRIEAFTSAFHGSIVNNGDGTFVYTPFTDFSGTDSFSYAVGNRMGGVATSIVRIRIERGAVSSWDVAPSDPAAASSWRWSDWENEETDDRLAHRASDRMPDKPPAAAANDMLIGGASVDTFKFDDSGVLDLSLLAGRITGIDQFDITASDTVELKLSFQDLLAMTESGHQLTILGDSGDKVSADFTGHNVAAADMGSFTRYVIDGGAAMLDIDNHVQRNIVGV